MLVHHTDDILIRFGDQEIARSNNVLLRHICVRKWVLHSVKKPKVIQVSHKTVIVIKKQGRYTKINRLNLFAYLCNYCLFLLSIV